MLLSITTLTQDISHTPLIMRSQATDGLLRQLLRLRMDITLPHHTPMLVTISLRLTRRQRPLRQRTMAISQQLRRHHITMHMYRRHLTITNALHCLLCKTPRSQPLDLCTTASHTHKVPLRREFTILLTNLTNKRCKPLLKLLLVTLGHWLKRSRRALSQPWARSPTDLELLSTTVYTHLQTEQ